MNCSRPDIGRTAAAAGPSRSGSVLIIVLWIAFGLVSITLYFAQSTSLELRAADNRASAQAAEEAIDGATRYVSYILSAIATNGTVPDYTAYYREAVPVGEAHFWLIGRTYENQVTQTEPFFGLVDEASKLDLNVASTNMLGMLPRMTLDLLANIIQWRSTNGGGAATYATLHPPYLCKNTNFETTDELRLVYGATMDLLVGEDANRNGVLDPVEYDEDHDNQADCGLLEYLTVYTREPNTRSDGSARINISSSSQTRLASLLQTNLGASRANAVLARLGTSTTFRSPLQFYLRSGMSSDEFGLIANDITVTSGAYIRGRVNVNTASPVVLACLPGLTDDLAQQLVSYRLANPDRITNSIAWVADALGQNNSTTLQTLAAGDYITVRSYQFSADVAALGPYGRGYKRVRFVFDTSNGTPQIIYRQDLSHLGWALGRQARDTWFLANTKR